MSQLSSRKQLQSSSLIVQVLSAFVSSKSKVSVRRKAKKRKANYPRKSSVVRQRVSMDESYERLGPAGFRRLYRMHYDSFCKLHTLLEEGIQKVIDERRPKNSTSDTRSRMNMGEPPIPNGPIPTNLRLGIALRFFKGCPSLDVSEIFGVSHAAVIDTSIWIVVQAINELAVFNLEYPADHQTQLKIAEGFRRVSDVEFDNCAGAIDGILIWIHKPSLSQSTESGIGQQKFFCGRKTKFGLNCQAVADVRGRFLDVSINYGGASSDLLAFEASTLCHRLEKGLLAPNLSLYGDNAYLNSPFMATPFPNVSSGSKDDYNFFQSQVRSSYCSSCNLMHVSHSDDLLLQVRIRVECSFGILVNRWAILRSIIPDGISIKRTIALVVALAKLNNFCIDEADEFMDYDSSLEPDPDVVATLQRRRRKPPRAVVPLVAAHRKDHGLNATIPVGLLDGGEHLLDHPRGTRKSDDNVTRTTDLSGAILPRESMLRVVIASGKTRPTVQSDGVVLYDV